MNSARIPGSVRFIASGKIMFTPQKLEAIRAYESVVLGDQGSLVERYRAEDQYVGNFLGIPFAEPFKTRSPLRVESPSAFLNVRSG